MTEGGDDRTENPLDGADTAARTRQLGHDIRSAVSDVIGGVRLIDPEGLDTRTRLQFDRVQSASELLARLVEELLGGTPRDTAGPVGNLNLRRFLDDELRRWHGAAEGTGVTVKADITGNLPDIVQLPLLPLRRIVANLMSNALRHAGGDQVTLGNDLSTDGTLSIWVQDNGRGLPKAYLREGADVLAISTGNGDSGMGLHIAVAHATAIGASLRFERVPTGGARIVLTIPHDVWSRLEEPDASDGLPDLRGFRILIADDTDTSRLLVQSMLTQLGAECEVASDGIEALNWLARERFDLALIDIEMPLLGGLDVLRSERLRQAQGIAPPTSMVAMTAYVLHDNREAIMDAGADGILSKPVGSLSAFGNAVWHFLQGAPDGTAWSPESAPVLSAVTLSELMAAAGADQAENLLERLREDLRIVEARLGAALSAGDPEAVSAQAHILLSLSSAIGALPTQETARRLNRLARDGATEAMTITGKICLGRLAALRAELATAI